MFLLAVAGLKGARTDGFEVDARTACLTGSQVRAGDPAGLLAVVVGRM